MEVCDFLGAKRCKKNKINGVHTWSSVKGFVEDNWFIEFICSCGAKKLVICVDVNRKPYKSATVNDGTMGGRNET